MLPSTERKKTGVPDTKRTGTITLLHSLTAF